MWITFCYFKELCRCNSLVISKVSVADFEHVFVCWEIVENNYCCSSNTSNTLSSKQIHSKSTTETLKQETVSLLTTCNMSKTFLKRFSGVL